MKKKYPMVTNMPHITKWNMNAVYSITQDDYFLCSSHQWMLDWCGMFRLSYGECLDWVMLLDSSVSLILLLLTGDCCF